MIQIPCPQSVLRRSYVLRNSPYGWTVRLDCGVEFEIYLNSHGIRLQCSIIKFWQIFSNERHCMVTWRKIDIDFFRLFRVFHRFSINIWVEVHFFFHLHWGMKGQSIPNANDKKVFQSLNTCIKNVNLQ